MEKHLVTIEFRYLDAPKYTDDSTYKGKIVTIGVFDDFDEACVGGNEILEEMEKIFPLNLNYNRKERFSKNSGCLGGKKDLISNLGYLETPFTFFIKITTLKFETVELIKQTINDVVKSVERYRQYKKR